MVTTLTRAGFDVITIDFEKAMADFNTGAAGGTPMIAYDYNWMIPSCVPDKQLIGDERPFPTYTNLAEYVKGGDPFFEERGRRGHPIENAYMLSLLLEYL